MISSPDGRQRLPGRLFSGVGITSSSVRDETTRVESLPTENPTPAARNGQRTLREWIPEVYRRACDHAHRMLTRWRGVNRPDTASLVDRAVCELLKWGEAPCASREHALALLVQKMRHVSVDIAKNLSAKKRGGPGRGEQAGDPPPRTLVSLEHVPSPAAWDHAHLLAIDEALDRLESLSPRLKDVVALRYLLGLTVEETAQQLGVAANSVKRDTQLARAWLLKELADHDEASASAGP